MFPSYDEKPVHNVFSPGVGDMPKAWGSRGRDRSVAMQRPAYFGGTYDEAMELMLEARHYLSYVEQRERRKVEAMTGLRMSCEAMRVTSRLTQVMAWLMMQRAVHQGEIEALEALSDQNRLSGLDVCLDQTFSGDETLPKGLRSLLERSLRLYERIARLEHQMLQRLH